MSYIVDTLSNLLKSTAFASLSWGNLLMICVALFFLYLAVAKGYEPLLLVPISFGMLLVNMYPSIMAEPIACVETYYDTENEKIFTIKDGVISFDKYELKELTVAYTCKDKEVEVPRNLEEAYNTLNEKYYLDEVHVAFTLTETGEEIVSYDICEGKESNFSVKDFGRREETSQAGGILHYFFQLDEWSILPCLIFMGVGAMTDFGPLIANPKSFLLGAAAQLGIFAAYLAAIFLGFNDKAAAAISIIGGADGPTSIFLAGKLGQTEYMGAIAVAAYSYMSLVPIIQPPIMKLLTTKEERAIKMEQLRPVSKLEKILFPIIVTIVVVAVLPDTAPLIGCLMLGNLFRESGVVRQLQETASNAMMYIVVILLGTSVGATTSAEAFLKVDTLKIVALGLIAFAIGTAGGVLLGKLMCKLTGGKINPLIGSAGVSAVPMAARVSQKVGSEADPTNFLLMHAMGPNVAGVIGTAVAAGVFMAVFGV